MGAGCSKDTPDPATPKPLPVAHPLSEDSPESTSQRSTDTAVELKSSPVKSVSLPDVVGATRRLTILHFNGASCRAS